MKTTRRLLLGSKISFFYYMRALGLKESPLSFWLDWLLQTNNTVLVLEINLEQISILICAVFAFRQPNVGLETLKVHSLGTAVCIVVNTSNAGSCNRQACHFCRWDAQSIT